MYKLTLDRNGTITTEDIHFDDVLDVIQEHAPFEGADVSFLSNRMSVDTKNVSFLLEGTPEQMLAVYEQLTPDEDLYECQECGQCEGCDSLEFQDLSDGTEDATYNTGDDNEARYEEDETDSVEGMDQETSRTEHDDRLPS